MISALLYLQRHSIQNRLLLRFRRLKQPKYLIGALVGGLYFYFYFFRLIFLPFNHLRGGVPTPPIDPRLYESLGALILFLLVLWGWIFPRKRAALTFTEAEIAFLFPAPITRRGLLHYKLLRSQLGIGFSVLFLALISRRFGSGQKMWMHLIGWWAMLSTLNLHFLATSFTQTFLMDRGLTSWKRRILVLGVVAGGLTAICLWAAHFLPPLTHADLKNMDAIQDYARSVLVSGPLPWLVLPFRLLIRPYLATTPLEFLNTLWPVALLVFVNYLWVLRLDVAFEEASVEASRKLAERVSAFRAGRGLTARFKRKRPPFNLSPLGWPPVALLWKNLIAAGQAFTLRRWIVLAVIIFALSTGTQGTDFGSNWKPAIGMIACGLAVWSIVLGPQMFRHDLRQDLPVADQLKLYPLRGWQIVAGEILAPAVILTAVQWLLAMVAVAFLANFGGPELPPERVGAIGLAAAIVMPGFNLIALLIPNAAVLLFPAWFQTGKDAPQGIEATGQRLIFVIGQFLAFAVALIPAAIAYFIVFLLIKMLGSVVLAIPAAAAVAAVVLAVEAGIGMVLLGKLFDRLDLSGEPAN